MKRAFTLASLALTAALAAGQGVPSPHAIPPSVGPRELGPDDPNQKKNALPALPAARGLLSGEEARMMLQYPSPTMPSRGLSDLPSREMFAIPMPSHTATLRSLGESNGRSGEMFQLAPNEKSNKLVPLPSVKEFQNSKSLDRLDLPAVSPAVPNHFAIPSSSR